MNRKLQMFHCRSIALADVLGTLVKAVPVAAETTSVGSESIRSEAETNGGMAAWRGLLYTPECCGFAVLGKDGLRDHDARAWPLASVFEARVFSPAGELRWIHVRAGQGRAALLTADSQIAAPEGWETCERDFLEKRDNGYLLWGKADSVQDVAGWTRLFEARIGELLVPFRAATETPFLRLKTIEFLGEVPGDPHGNVRLIEEQLTGFEPHPRR